ncbi:hypothetical protein OC844_000253 [Tilletia horrida]|nr:hypothetical protein OC844_000253 [Tilletia horrida]
MPARRMMACATQGLHSTQEIRTQEDNTSTVVSSAALSSEAAAAFMDIDGAGLEDGDGFATIDQDASDEPTQILMIVGFQEQLKARDLGLALHAHFDAQIRRDEKEPAPGAWLTKLPTLSSLPETAGGPITNTGKAFAICADVATAQRVLEEFEEQYLAADVDEGLRLELPSEVTQRLVQDGFLPAEQTRRTDQLLICYASTTVLQQCRMGDTRDSRSTFPSTSNGAQLGLATLTRHSRPIEPGEDLDSQQQINKRSRSALVREALKSAAYQSAADSPLAWPDAAVLASAVQQAKVEFIKEQLAYGVPVVVPLELHTPLISLGIRLGPANQPPSNKVPSPMHALPVKPGTHALPSAALEALPSPSPSISVPPASTTAAAGLASAPAQGDSAAAKAPSVPAAPASRFLPPRPSSETISEAAKLRERAKASAAATTAVVSKANTSVATSTSGTAANKSAPSPVGSKHRQHSLSGMAPMPAQKEKSTPESAAVNPKVEAFIQSRWDLKELTPEEPPTDKPMHKEPPLKKVKSTDTDAMQGITTQSAPSVPATSKSASAAKVESAPTRSSRRIASGRSSIHAPAQAPPNFPSSSANQDEAAAGAEWETPTPLEIHSGMRLPPPMDGFTRSLGERDGEVPRNFDFCNPDRMLCLLCLRQFKSLLTLKKYVAESNLHQNNLDSAAARRAGAAQLIQTYRPPRTPATSSSSGAGAGSNPSAPVSTTPLAVSVPAADLAAVAATSPVASTYRDRELERRAVRGPAPLGP